MPPETPRRRILYIRHRRAAEISDAYRMNQDEWVETLSALADVALYNHSFDLDAACDKIQPDFIVYEAPFFPSEPLDIAHPRAHPHIPRMGLQIQDPYSAIRVHYYRTLEKLDIPWMFSHMAETAVRQSPETACRTFSIGHLFDERVFRDYGLEKDIPASVFGGFLSPDVYDWRAACARDLPHHVPTLIYTHPGYQKPVARHKFEVTGEAYARLLNRSCFSLADTTVFGCLVRKHLEIPACGALLAAPDAPVLRAYGFRDRENCLLGQGEALYDKIKSVADDPGLYEKIRRAGHDLVHARHGRKNWRYLLDFYECLRMRQAGETVRQEGWLGPFRNVPDRAPFAPSVDAPLPDSLVSRQFQRWTDELLTPEAAPGPIPPWAATVTEPFPFMALLVLLRGDAAQARALLLRPQEIRQTQSGYADFDPIEIAWLSLVAALTGDATLRDLTRRESASMRHLSLRRMLWLGQVLAGQASLSAPPDDVIARQPPDQPSIHWTGDWALANWLSFVARVLAAHGQADLAAKLT